MDDRREDQLMISDAALRYYLHEAEDLGPEEEALGWVLAARVGMTDAIGGAAWERYCREGLVSREAQELLRRIDPTLDLLGPWPEGEEDD
jgi:hypothetical protein